ncbi:MAG: DUF4234 domain-containing protein [Candidatus Marinimicrobia bacterium]|jgi:hypothetical protein|nr:DUF4234 domain-containing protein [Candidatus Neomarinimicrobiota bacterium]
MQEKGEQNSEQQVNVEHPENVSAQQPYPRKRIGKNRSVFAPLLLPFITLGIYFLVWYYKIYSEAEFYCDRKVKTTSGGAAVGFLFIPIFNIIWSIMLLFKTPGLLTKMQIADGVPENKIKHYGHYGWLCLIPIVGSIIWIILIQSAFNTYWDNVRKS